MNGLRHRVGWSAAILGLLILTATIIASCGGTQANVDPKALLAECSANMKKMQGFHFVYEAHRPASEKPPSGIQVDRVIGDVNAQGSIKADVYVTYSGSPLTIPFIQIGSVQYIKVGLWQTVKASDSPVGALDVSAGTVRILDKITGVTYVGQEKRAGAQTYHLKGTVAGAEVAALAGVVTTTQPFPTDLWIGVKDQLIYEVDITGPTSPDENPKIRRSIILSNFNHAPAINAPK